jgi:hypothetical protein
MKISELWKSYEFYTQGLTDHSRKLAFAAAAICWFFKTPQVSFPPSIIRALLCIVSFFFLDIGHYLLGAFLIRIWIRKQEKRIWKEESKLADAIVDKPAWLDTLPAILFLLKIIVLLISFCFIVYEFILRLK